MKNVECRIYEIEDSRLKAALLIEYPACHGDLSGVTW